MELLEKYQLGMLVGPNIMNELAAEPLLVGQAVQKACCPGLY